MLGVLMVSSRERVTISIPRSLLASVDSLVDGRAVRNRSHAIETLVLKALSGSGISTAFILAGGKGERLMPLTEKTPKLLLSVGGKPIIVRVLEWLGGNGVQRVVLGLGYKANKFRKVLGDGSKFGLELIYSEEKEPMGTAGCLTLARDFLRSTFVMMNGDILTDFNLRHMIDFHRKNNGLATVALKNVEDPFRFGVAELDGYKITRFVEKPKHPPTHLINAGVYVLEPQVLDLIKGPSSIEIDVFPAIAEQGKLFGYPISANWIDVGTPESLKTAEELFA